MNLDTENKFSLLLERALNALGYSMPTIKASQVIAESLEGRMNDFKFPDPFFVFYLAGSKREGVSLFAHGSDFDCMLIFKQNRFTDISSRQRPNGYSLELRNCPPGYARLKVGRDCLFKWTTDLVSNECPYLSSEANNVFGLMGYEVTFNVAGPSMERSKTISGNEFADSRTPPYKGKQTGPSYEVVTDVFQTGMDTSMDFVLSIPGQCSRYMRVWRKRRRPYNFPTKNQIQEISKMDAHVVPVGCKNTQNVDLQWRICFTFAEIALIKSFNATQYKVYAVLKMLSKEVIKQISPDITSYVMKNIILWVSELYPPSLFQENNIPKCLIVCLHFLRQCIRNRYLPNYMIPDRDLLYGKLNDKKVMKLDALLDGLIGEGGRMVLRCEQIQYMIETLSKFPEVEEMLLNNIQFTLCLANLAVTIEGDLELTDKVKRNLSFFRRLLPHTSYSQGFNILVDIKQFKRIIHATLPHVIDRRDLTETLGQCQQLERQFVDALLQHYRRIVRRLISEFLFPQKQSNNIESRVQPNASSQLVITGITDYTFQNNKQVVEADINQMSDVHANGSLKERTDLGRRFIASLSSFKDTLRLL